jgi:sulfur transfer complex TusBCD TusB component (DsrH family)
VNKQYELELSEEELSVLLGAIGSFLEENRKNLKIENPEVYLACLSEDMTARSLAQELAELSGWSKETLEGFLRIGEEE